MNKKYDSTDLYLITTTNKILTLAPIVGAIAAFTFTITHFFGFFEDVSISSLVGFDIACLSYFVVASYLKKKGITKGDRVDEKKLKIMEVCLGGLILLQWNLITYLFPTRSFWGYAPMFVLLTAFLFRRRAVFYEIVGISLSIVVSWIIKGDKLLPIKDEMFEENLSLRIVALIVSFAVIYAITYFAEKFTIKVKENYHSIEKQNNEFQAIGKDIIDFTADIIEERDVTSGNHVKRLKTSTRILANQIAKNYPEYGLNEEKIDQIVCASVLHDVGKIAIPDNILLKPSKLSKEEFEIMKTHTSIGAKIIDKLPDSIGESYKKYCREICLFHHEKYDGKGYPIGLKGDDIPISAQIVSVVDCLDALCNDRPYKKALPGQLAIQMILNGECGVFFDKIKASVLACKEELLNV